MQKKNTTSIQPSHKTNILLQAFMAYANNKKKYHLTLLEMSIIIGNIHFNLDLSFCLLERAVYTGKCSICL